jgi:hypothetical protein
MDNNFRFLYWDDPGDSQSNVDNQAEKQQDEETDSTNS